MTRQLAVEADLHSISEPKACDHRHDAGRRRPAPTSVARGVRRGRVSRPVLVPCLRRAAELLQLVLAERVPDAGGLDPHARLVAILRKRQHVSRVGLAVRPRRVDQPEPRPRTLERRCSDVPPTAPRTSRPPGPGSVPATSPASCARARAGSRSSDRRSRAGICVAPTSRSVGVSLKRTSGSCDPGRKNISRMRCAASNWRSIAADGPTDTPDASARHVQGCARGIDERLELVLEERVEDAVVAEQTPEVGERHIDGARRRRTDSVPRSRQRIRAARPARSGCRSCR